MVETGPPRARAGKLGIEKEPLPVSQIASLGELVACDVATAQNVCAWGCREQPSSRAAI